MNNALNKNILIAIILIFGISAGILGYLKYKNETTPIPSPTPAQPPEVWETYTNSQLGFSIKYPQMVYGVYRCEPLKPFYVPLKIFEDNENGIAYLTEEYYHEAPYNSELNDYTGPCKKITYTLESLKKEKGKYGNPYLARVFIIKNIKNETDLNKFVKDNYGSGCFVEKKVLWKSQEGVYDIVLKGEDWDKETSLGTTACPISGDYKILYSPEKGKLMSVGLGQECGFGTDYNNQKTYKCYDKEIINSFKFN